MRWRLFLLFLLLANVYLVASQLPFLVFISRTPADRVFPLYHSGSWFDYNTYLSAITQGAHGALLMRDAYTTEPTNPSLFYSFYVIVGKVTGVVGLPAYFAYHLARLAAVEFFFLTLFILTRQMLGVNLGFWAAIIAIIATISPGPLFQEPQAFKTYTPWWADQDAFKRLDLMPHYLTSYGLLFLAVVSLFKFLHRPSWPTLAVGSASVFVAGIFLPPAVIPMVIAAPLACGFTLLSRVKRSTDLRPWLQPFQLSERETPHRKPQDAIHPSSLHPGLSGAGVKQSPMPASQPARLLGLTLIVMIALSALLLISRENSNGFPWEQWNRWERAMWNQTTTNFNRGLVFAFGITPLLAIPAVVGAFRLGRFDHIFVSLWAFLPFLILPFIDLVGFSKYRLVTTAPFVPLAILATTTIFQLVKSRLTQVALLLVFLASTVPVSLSLLRNNVAVAKAFPLYPIMFIPSANWQAIQFIKTTVPKNSVILSDIYLGSILPAQAPVVTFVGHEVHTAHLDQKKLLLARFFSGKMSGNEARQFLTAHRVSFIFFGPDEQKYGLKKLLYPGLEAVYQNVEVTIYQVK